MKKKILSFSLIAIILLFIIYIFTNIYDKDTVEKSIKDMKISISKGDFRNISANFILEKIDTVEKDTDCDYISYPTYTVEDSSLYSYYRYSNCSTGYCDIEPIEEYIRKNSLTIQSFVQNIGNLRLFYKDKNRNLYIISNIYYKPYKWKLLIEDNKEYKIIEITEMDEASINFASKIKVENDNIKIYLESGLYIIDNNYNVSSIKYDVNDIFSTICNMGLIPSTTRIEYLNGCLYIICTNKEFEYSLVEYDIEKDSIKKFELYNSLQFITSIQNKILIISTDKNKVFINTLLNEEVISKEIKDISNLNLDNFKIQSAITKLINDDENIYFILNNNDNTESYIFNIEYKTSNLKGFKKINYNSSNCYLIGTNLNFK